MKKIIFIVYVFSLLSSGAIGRDFDHPQEILTPPREVYIPQGFDNNDVVEFFFEGEFANSCYKKGLSTFSIDEKKRDIYVTDLSYYFGESICSQVIIPYQKGIKVGLLDPGHYKVKFRHSRGNFVDSGVVPVVRSLHSKADDFLYAPVSHVIYVPGEEGKAGYARLLGRFTTDCMKMDEVKVVVRSHSNVVDILPIVFLEENCESQRIRDFEVDVDLSDYLFFGRFLLHVRANNGQSVNQIVSVAD